jgi:hypothetical protein
MASFVSNLKIKSKPRVKDVTTPLKELREVGRLEGKGWLHLAHNRVQGPQVQIINWSEEYSQRAQGALHYA